MGYHRAGFEVVGVDIKPQPHYPFEFHQADAMTYPLDGFDVIHANPPCQAFSYAASQWRAQGREYPDLLTPTRTRLQASGLPYVIENVPGAPLKNPTILNGPMFGLHIHRTRLFETNFPLPLVLLPQAGKVGPRMGRAPKEGEMLMPIGHFSGVDYGRREMGCPWMNQGELAQAIPPAYTEYIGKELLKVLATYGQPLREHRLLAQIATSQIGENDSWP